MSIRIFSFSFCVLVIALGSTTSVCAADYALAVRAREILTENCYACHGPDAATREAEFRLDQRESAVSVLQTQPGQIVPELLARVFSTDADLVMPPTDSRKSLTQAERQVLKEWIEAGAPFARHWSFVPPQRPVVPADGAGKEQHPVDAFVRRRLKTEGLSPSPRARREVLIRRAALDLTGLPPEPELVAAFVQNESPDAFEKAIDHFLAQETYGEHMAVKWLEASRYADTDGYQNDRYRYMSPWRDWVILAYNKNKPYDEFVIEQLAGDMLPNANLMQQVATGFCRNHRINSEDGSIPDEWHVENVVDRVDTLGTVFLGLTLGCARCHDHKYDPISQAEYYQIFVYFNNVTEWGVGPNNGNSPPFIKLPKSWPELSSADNAFITPEPVALRPSRKNDAGNGLKRPQAGNPETVMVMHERAEPRATYLLRRGQYDQPDKTRPLSAAVPAALNASGDRPTNRLELARWLVHPENPLVARVAVNRIWEQFFGTGLVRSSENFGSQGEKPSHPELLDWLATEFIQNGWNVKALQKTIMLSDTYQQSSARSSEVTRRDPKNRLLSHGPRFRLSAYALRDQALSVSGLLVQKVGGPSVKPYMPPQIWRAISNNTYKQDKGDALYRRSLYTYWRRTIPPPTMMNFNAGNREVCTVRTESTNTPLQALTLLNNRTFVEAARFLAERTLRDGGEDDAQRVQYAFRLMTCRSADEFEQNNLLTALEEFRRYYADNKQAATTLLKTGAKPRDESFDVTEHAAMTMLASLLLNLDEAVTRE